MGLGWVWGGFGVGSGRVRASPQTPMESKREGKGRLLLLRNNMLFALRTSSWRETVVEVCVLQKCPYIIIAL